MAPAEYLMQDVTDMSEERILDLCSAPGGKSTQIAAKMAGKGILLCNEIHPARAKILSENIERMGVRNAMVLNETPQHLAEQFEGFFTRILVDAPCSGEGMFRKNEEACGEWSLSNVELCAERQDEILDCAASMLSPGGRLVYSTCTFAPSENEGSIGRFLERHTDFTVLPVSKADGMQSGVPEWGNGDIRLKETIRLWPHRLRGEGHYMAVLQKAGTPRAGGGFCRNGLETPGKGSLEFEAFARETLKVSLQGIFVKFGDQLYLAPEGMPSVKGLKVLRPGLHLGTVKKDRFEPSHALALALRPEESLHQINLSATPESQIYGYINGETFPAEGEKGWYLITVDGYSIGWGKLAGGIMKNHYPKGLRKKLI
jgi:NOL1/NOP2/fmu family ribosome biogenesis protein/23S rRNA U2552 (ribose-2'-O)-methylase RlmE/FtsJ